MNNAHITDPLTPLFLPFLTSSKNVWYLQPPSDAVTPKGSFLSILDNGELACELGLDAKYWLTPSPGEKGSGGGKVRELGYPHAGDAGNVVSVCYGKQCGLGGGSQPSNLAKQSFHCGHISLEEIRQPGSDVPVSALPLSHTEKL